MVVAGAHSAAIRTRSKTRHSDHDEQRALSRAAWLWRDTPVWVAVISRGRHVGDVKGDPVRGRTLIRCGQDHPYVDYDQAVVQKTSGRHWAQYWTKAAIGTHVIDNWYDLWGLDGYPQAGNWSGTALTARQFTGSTAGALYTGGNVTPAIKYLTRASMLAYANGTGQSPDAFVLYDRVLSYDACTMTAGSQSMTNTLAATRYISTGDPGLQIFIEADTVHNATAANLTVLTYVNETGTASRTVVTTPTLSKIVSIAAPTKQIGARAVIQTPGGSTKNANPYLTLQAGDEGVRSITNFTWSAAPTGTNAFVLQFPYALFIDGVGTATVADQEFQFGIDSINKRIYDDACLSFLHNPHVGNGHMDHGWVEAGW